MTDRAETAPEVAALLSDCARHIVQGLDGDGRTALLDRLAAFLGASGVAFFIDQGPMLRDMELLVHRRFEAAASLRSLPARAWVEALAAGRPVWLVADDEADALAAEFCDWLGVGIALLLPVRSCGELEGVVILREPRRGPIPDEVLAVAGLLGSCAAPGSATGHVPASVVRHACHEMRNALNALLSGAEFLEEELGGGPEVSDDVREVIADMLTASERAERALEDLHRRAIDAG